MGFAKSTIVPPIYSGTNMFSTHSIYLIVEAS